jgi:hypothetical protein
MQKQTSVIFAGVCALLLAGLCASPARAQQKMNSMEKPPMYSYVANWDVARGQWKAMKTEQAAGATRMRNYLNDGTIVAYGSDVNLVHQEKQDTHDDWWSAMSWAGLMKVLAGESAAGAADAPVFAASKHHDDIYVSRYYNWKSGSFTNGYTRVAVWKLRADAPHDAVERLSENMMVPMLEKLLADGSIYEYELDTQAVHTTDPDTFLIVLVANGPEGLDKFDAAIHDMNQSNPMAGPAFGSWIDSSAHRDGLYLTTATYK